MYIEQVGERTLKDCKVLIVDDQASSRLVLETLLEDTVPCTSVSSGQEAIEYCKFHTPDLILMDVSMPELDGHQTTALLRSKPLCAHIPIIFVTSSSTDEEETRCWDSGCVDFVVKPVNACTLRNRVKSHINHKLRNDLLEKLIYVDKLTGAYNRHYLDDYLPRLVKDGLRTSTPLALVIFDIDHFKLFNDMYGHLDGDSCLWKVSKTINDALLRPMDKLVRIGGEEFLVILPNTDVEGATAVTERLLKTVYDLNIPHSASGYGRITLSAGLAIKHTDASKTIDHVMLEADKNLYAAKTSGRNQLKAPSVVIKSVSENHHAHVPIKSQSE
ncbi:diguanylate cyclase response regulator [Alteromonas mediterranea]|uniref:diguanylate cyclase n=1 Tax=Alteromonas mediterranea TaxID=314275 RepID=A0AAC9JEX3_9ALTE|nr:diguanylate cyclase [Alteromonas mediterranea]APD91106.1 diguanylate cyclase response regulator [Alteromonas mediterranea]APD95325.1 diguanylate cyclase response regulator [Alteromonas mediterranea]APD98963.1 diguanylate cyclase response regulator [Alteromonas mediterranea]APE03203.1 diguanylate cyclase response regulator [Alteromonas mediterranea]QGX63228.1 diguanylate cyclase [Alteromonas mediterranea]